ncbi:helix-turn-helix transcriptional regulator [Leucobacter sp. W1038]|uniref:helix-turn-helix transcriptional regulator n=1 Tax=Leucobacter sp. W1038 TaxID=3438281 RepID=UPI003D98D75C
MTTITKTATVYLTPEQVCEIIPGMTKGNLAQLRFKGIGPKFYKPTPRVVLYSRDQIIAWVEGSERTGTAEA